ncbi:MAG TPA: hypothetical protein ENF38_01660 [Candidatus Aenigmarchaeota archaeon]|nr:hypothetical protein [Candidatus Aenigmarchaeota archaeon]
MSRTPKCAICKKPLSGVPKQKPSLVRKLSKTEKRVNRPYGGYLCSRCMRKIMREKVRERFKV